MMQRYNFYEYTQFFTPIYLTFCFWPFFATLHFYISIVFGLFSLIHVFFMSRYFISPKNVVFLHKSSNSHISSVEFCKPVRGVLLFHLRHYVKKVIDYSNYCDTMRFRSHRLRI